VVLIGNASVRKTAIASVLRNAPFNPDSAFTVGGDAVIISYVGNSKPNISAFGTPLIKKSTVHSGQGIAAVQKLRFVFTM
jgi:hypothetical protein